MSATLRKYGGPGILFLIGLGFDVSSFFGSSVVAYGVWGLAAIWAIYAGLPQIKRVRIGLAPPDAELREAKEAQKRLFSEFKQAHQERGVFFKANQQARAELEEAKKEVEALRAENEQLIAENERPGSQSDDEELKQRCLEVSADLFRFAQERDKTAPPEATLQMSGGFWDAIKENIADPKTQERTNYDNETRRQYSEVYGGDVGALFDALERRGWFDAGERKTLEEQPGNEFVSPTPSIRQIAQRLAAIGKRL